MKNLSVYGFTHAIVDVTCEVTFAEVASLGISVGARRLVSADEQRTLLERFASGGAATICGGGSLANSLAAIAGVGGTVGLSCLVGRDRFGNHYVDEFKSLGAELEVVESDAGATGVCLVLLTPGGERTMFTSLGVGLEYDEGHFGLQLLQGAQWLFLEGYMLSNGEPGVRAMRKAIRAARASGTKIAFSVSDQFLIEQFRGSVEEIIAESDLVFANSAEARALTGAETTERAVQQLHADGKIFAVTAGERGVYVVRDETVTLFPAFACEPVDLTGAGDAFAGGFLYAIERGATLERAARCGCFLALKVISQRGARLGAVEPIEWQRALCG